MLISNWWDSTELFVDIFRKQQKQLGPLGTKNCWSVLELPAAFLVTSLNYGKQKVKFLRYLRALMFLNNLL